jgi:hypothetical protein
MAEGTAGGPDGNLACQLCPCCLPLLLMNKLVRTFRKGYVNDTF